MGVVGRGGLVSAGMFVDDESVAVSCAVDGCLVVEAWVCGSKGRLLRVVVGAVGVVEAVGEAVGRWRLHVVGALAR